MHKYYMFALLLLSGSAFASIDYAECEKIGYERGTYTTSICETLDKCKERFADEAEKLKNCLSRVKTPEECELYVARRNAEVERKTFLYRCPVTDALMSQKNSKKSHANRNLVYDNGDKVNADNLIADEQNVYVFKAYEGISSLVGQDKYHVIGPVDKDGLFMSAFEE